MFISSMYSIVVDHILSFSCIIAIVLLHKGSVNVSYNWLFSTEHLFLQVSLNDAQYILFNCFTFHLSGIMQVFVGLIFIVDSL